MWGFCCYGGVYKSNHFSLVDDLILPSHFEIVFYLLYSSVSYTEYSYSFIYPWGVIVIPLSIP